MAVPCGYWRLGVSVVMAGCAWAGADDGFWLHIALLCVGPCVRACEWRDRDFFSGANKPRDSESSMGVFIC